MVMRWFGTSPSSSLSRTRAAIAALLTAGAALLTFAPYASPRPAFVDAEEFYVHHDHVIGTSLDLWVIATSEKTAARCEDVVLAEIERLRRIFSTYDPESDISRLNRATVPVPASAEMREVLHLYEFFERRAAGAFNGRLGELIRAWKQAQKTGIEPDEALLRPIVEAINAPGWKIDDTHRTVTRITNQALDLNSIAKGYIIQKAARAVLAYVPEVRGLLLNLGGDMSAWGHDVAGRPCWTIGIQDPFHPEENAVPLTAVHLQNKAIATSGAYERYYTVAGKRYSHIFDPRTGRPATGLASSTVIANDNVTANALATTLCVLSPAEGLGLAASIPGVECLIVDADGKRHASAGWQVLEIAQAPLNEPQDKGDKDIQAAKNKAADGWPDGYGVSISVTLPTLNDGKRYRKPYVAVWVENGDGKAVRSVAVWGNSPKYLKDLTFWWKIAKDDKDLVKAVTRATRAPGKYTLTWDGKDDKGKSLPQSAYTIVVEVHREHGAHLRQKGQIQCGTESATLTLERNAETEATVVEYARKK
jgi:FAD:protein FMN transferase